VLAAATTAESIEWAARHHAPLLMGFASTQQIADGFAYYRRFAHDECGWDPRPEDMGIIGPTYVSTSDASARAEAEDHVMAHYDELTALLAGGALREFTNRRLSDRSYAYRAGGQGDERQPQKADYETLSRQRYYIGSPDTVTRRIIERQEQLGVGLFATVSPFGSMQPPQARESIELFAKEVLPNLR
jgi:alkanesulfonate monooxygenase SsuD/methylene tetrahydromethanopterin reductase-like flavin-dependent oxidoreductase (luciferase family)